MSRDPNCFLSESNDLVLVESLAACNRWNHKFFDGAEVSSDPEDLEAVAAGGILITRIQDRSCCGSRCCTT